MKNKLQLIQLIRGFAAVIVLLSHVNSFTEFYIGCSWIKGFFVVGWFGVDFFFVLSGFIMMYVHYNDLEKRENQLTFFKKRFLRIYPVYWIIASIYFFLQIFTGKISFSADYIYIVKSYLLMQNSPPPFLRVAWSLVFECFFYLIFGLGIFAGLKIMKVFLFSWLTAIFLLGFFNLPMAHYFVFNNFILEFLFGCIIGYQFVYNKQKFKLNPNYLTILGVLIIIIVWIVSLNSDFGKKSDLESRLVYGIASALIILGAALLENKKSIIMPKFFLLLGNASYVIYLIHPIVFGIAYKISAVYLKGSNLRITVFGFLIAAIAVSVGIIFHLIIEKRIIKLKFGKQ